MNNYLLKQALFGVKTPGRLAELKGAVGRLLKRKKPAVPQVSSAKLPVQVNPKKSPPKVKGTNTRKMLNLSQADLKEPPITRTSNRIFAQEGSPVLQDPLHQKAIGKIKLWHTREGKGFIKKNPRVLEKTPQQHRLSRRTKRHITESAPDGLRREEDFILEGRKQPRITKKSSLRVNLETSEKLKEVLRNQGGS